MPQKSIWPDPAVSSAKRTADVAIALKNIADRDAKAKTAKSALDNSPRGKRMTQEFPASSAIRSKPVTRALTGKR